LDLPATEKVKHDTNQTERHYASLFDRHFLSRGVALHRSLERHSNPCQHWILCLDDETFHVLSLLGLPQARLIRLSELESANPTLLQAKVTRTSLEYYWTCGPAFLLFLLEQSPSPSMVTYVDADIFFFNDPGPIFAEMGDGNVWLVEHRFAADRSQGYDWAGRFNVGVLVFRRSDAVLACLRRWHAQCLEWCFDRHEPSRFGDQLYLNEWPDRYPGVIVSELPGVGVAYWNLDRYDFDRGGAVPTVDRHPLLYFHFSKVVRLTDWLYLQRRLGSYGQHLTRRVKRAVYAPYIGELQAARHAIRCLDERVDPAGTLRFSDGWFESLAELLRYQAFIATIGPMTL
jgi:hypothetical protein